MKIVLLHLGADGGSHLAEALRDFGHVVRTVESEDASGLGDSDFRPDAVVLRIESDVAAGLDAAVRLLSERPLAGAPVLVTGSNEVALEAARRRFPDASFARLDHVMTALSSIEADE